MFINRNIKYNSLAQKQNLLKSSQNYIFGFIEILKKLNFNSFKKVIFTINLNYKNLLVNKEQMILTTSFVSLI